ncbi:MAG: PKD domain-containing protein [Gemmatales bacterium]
MQLQSLGIDDGPASYPIFVQVNDGHGHIVTSASTSLTLGNANPTATLNNGGAVNEGSTGLVSFASASDPSLTDKNAGFKYSFDFNNDGVFEITDSTSASATVPSSFLADGPNSRLVRGRISDKNGGYTDYTTSIAINNVAPVVQALSGPTQAVPGQTASYTSLFSDVGVLDTHTVSFNWGDGTTSTGTVTESSGSGSFTGNHVYSSPGVFTITATVKDKDGATTVVSRIQTIARSILLLNTTASGCSMFRATLTSRCRAASISIPILPRL